MIKTTKNVMIRKRKDRRKKREIFGKHDLKKRYSTRKGC